MASFPDRRRGNFGDRIRHAGPIFILLLLGMVAYGIYLTQSLTTSLVNNLSLSVKALGLGLDITAVLGTVKPAVVTVLNGVTAPVDDLVYNTLAALGVHVGEADIRVTGATCGRSVLVQ